MKAKELRVGNYVYDRGLETDLKPSQLVNILQGIVECKPIQLTEGWLFKFGFYNNKDKFYIGEIQLYLDGNVWWNDEIINENMLYVHQLQNLYFALTNKELKLTK